MRRRARLAVLVSATGLFAASPGCGAMKKAAREGTELVLFAPDQDTTVIVDGETATVPGGKFKTFAVGPGDHEVVVGDRKTAVTLAAFDRYAVPLVDDQCFFSIDVTLSHYSSGHGGALGSIDLEQRRTESTPFEFPPSHYLDESELPETRTGANRTLLLRSLACGEIDRLERGESVEAKAPAEPVANDPVSKRFATASECEDAKGLTLAWCQQGKAWAAAATTELPPEGTLVGISLDLADGHSLGEAIASDPRPSFLAVARGDAPAAWLTTLEGDNPDEIASMNAFTKSVQAMFEGTATEMDLSGELASYLASMPERAEVALVNGESEHTIGEARVRKHGDYWLAYEPYDGGIYFSVLMPMKTLEADTSG